MVNKFNDFLGSELERVRNEEMRIKVQCDLFKNNYPIIHYYKKAYDREVYIIELCRMIELIDNTYYINKDNISFDSVFLLLGSDDYIKAMTESDMCVETCGKIETVYNINNYVYSVNEKLINQILISFNILKNPITIDYLTKCNGILIIYRIVIKYIPMTLFEFIKMLEFCSGI